jgi:hypothetical protein
MVYFRNDAGCIPEGQGSADRGPVAVLDDPVMQFQDRADQRQLPRLGLPKVGQTPIEQILLPGSG